MYLCFIITTNLSLESELDKRIGKSAFTMDRLTTKVWSNINLTIKTKMAIYKACVLSILLYRKEEWTTYIRQEKWLNAFHMRDLHRILGITMQAKIPNDDVLEKANILSIFTLLMQRRLRWLGHIRCMGDIGSQNLSSMVNWILEVVPMSAQSCSTTTLTRKMWRILASMSQIGKTQLPIAQDREQPWQDSWRKKRRSWEKHGPTRNSAGREGKITHMP